MTELNQVKENLLNSLNTLQSSLTKVGVDVNEMSPEVEPFLGKEDHEILEQFKKDASELTKGDFNGLMKLRTNYIEKLKDARK